MNTNHIYMAGLLDGEGTIGIARSNGKTPYRAPYISVSSTTVEIMDWLAANYGGYVSVHKVYQEHYKQSWAWKLKTVPKVFDTLENVLPHMLEPEKIRRGRLILDQYPLVTVRNGKYSPEMKERKLAFETNFLSKVE